MQLPVSPSNHIQIVRHKKYLSFDPFSGKLRFPGRILSEMNQHLFGLPFRVAPKERSPHLYGFNKAREIAWINFVAVDQDF